MKALIRNQYKNYFTEAAFISGGLKKVNATLQKRGKE